MPTFTRDTVEADLRVYLTLEDENGDEINLTDIETDGTIAGELHITAVVERDKLPQETA